MEDMIPEPLLQPEPEDTKENESKKVDDDSDDVMIIEDDGDDVMEIDDVTPCKTKTESVKSTEKQHTKTEKTPSSLPQEKLTNGETKKEPRRIAFTTLQSAPLPPTGPVAPATGDVKTNAGKRRVQLISVEKKPL